MARFNVGSKYPFIKVHFSLNGNPAFWGMYLPWEHKLESIELVMLECTEHHKVPSEWDPKPEPALDYDGFIFKGPDFEGKPTVWHNQYPRASYGQVSDAADRIVSLHIEDIEEIRKALDSGRTYELDAAFPFLDRILHGVYTLEHTDPSEIEDLFVKVQNLADFATQVRIAIQDASGRAVVTDKLTYGPTKKWLKGNYQSRFADESGEDSHFTID